MAEIFSLEVKALALLGSPLRSASVEMTGRVSDDSSSCNAVVASDCSNVSMFCRFSSNSNGNGSGSAMTGSGSGLLQATNKANNKYSMHQHLFTPQK